MLLGLFLAIVISSGLEFLVDFLEKKGLPRTLGVILIFLSATVLAIFTIYTVVPLIIIDLNNAFSNLSKLSAEWPFLSVKATQSIGELVNRISQEVLGGSSSPIGALSDVLGGVLLGFSVLISSFYLSLSHDGVERFIKAVFPVDYESMALRVYERARRRIAFWFRTQILLSAVMAISVFAALTLLGVKYAFLLAILAGVSELVPLVGPILSGAAAVIAALVTSPQLALYTLGAFLVLHQIENHVLVPLLVGRNMGLHPVIVIIALLIGGEVGGVLGLLIAVPAAVLFQEIIEDWSGRKKSQELAFS